MRGQVYKIFSDFYYVNTEFGSIECKLREILKKKSENVLVGDNVEIDAITEDKKQAFISKVYPRTNFLSRPKVANISKAIIVSALKNPDLDFEQLDRYIALCEYHKIKPVLCFNKCDLLEDKHKIEEIKNIYNPLKYETLFTSAIFHIGTDKILKILENNTSILCGASGVGKSSIIKNFVQDMEISTKEISEKTKRGVHTTRHCEIYKISDNTFIVDTPGFSNAKFDFLLPQEVQKLFPEISQNNNCRYKDCLHIRENDCNVIENSDKISVSRYESYKKFVEEAKAYKQKITYEGKKIETATKYNKGKDIAKLSERKRNLSRKTIKQNINKQED